jgi:hypothetical protein
MLVYLSKTTIFGSKRHENIEELPHHDFKVTLYGADIILGEDRSGGRRNFVDFDCLIVRKIKEACEMAETIRQECLISMVSYETEKVKFSRVVDIKVAKW